MEIELSGIGGGEEEEEEEEEGGREKEGGGRRILQEIKQPHHEGWGKTGFLNEFRENKNGFFFFVSLCFFYFQRLHQWERVLFEIALRARSALLCRSELAARVRFDIALPLD